jgi:hypothetical protein
MSNYVNEAHILETMFDLVLTMLLMYPGSTTTIQKTVLARYETIYQCEHAKDFINIKYNSSLECVKVGKKKI